MNLAFVLLPEARLPRGEAIVRAFDRFAGDDEGLRLRKPQGSSDGDVLELDVSPAGTATIAVISSPVPEREADEAVRFSLSAMGYEWTLPPHRAHLVVSFADGPTSLVARLSCFTSLLAAIVKASDAVAVYWGDAGATHGSEFFMTTARETGIVPRITLWTGVSVAGEPDGRLSLLSLGMQQLSLPDLLLVAPRASASEALATLFDLLACVAQLGTPLLEGDTIGGSAGERLPVQYVSSPLDPGTRVCRVEIT